MKKNTLLLSNSFLISTRFVHWTIKATVTPKTTKHEIKMLQNNGQILFGKCNLKYKFLNTYYLSVKVQQQLVKSTEHKPENKCEEKNDSE